MINKKDSFNKVIQKRGKKLFQSFRSFVKDARTNKEIEKEIEKIAEKEGLDKKSLVDFFKHKLFLLLSEKIDIRELTEASIKTIKEANIEGLSFIQSDLRKIIEKSMYLATRFGFKRSVSEAGIRTANEGDSAQFLFVARSILAGFNCSNVDLRSSKYDAIIDYNSTLLRVQIKGVSLNSSISFVNRARGGQGIDHKHPSNRAKRISKKDCDLYVAVNKETGICYIIPMEWVDKLGTQVQSMPQSKLLEFKESWSIIEKIATRKT